MPEKIPLPTMGRIVHVNLLGYGKRPAIVLNDATGLNIRVQIFDYIFTPVIVKHISEQNAPTLSVPTWEWPPIPPKK